MDDDEFIASCKPPASILDKRVVSRKTETMSWKFGSTFIVISVSLHFHAANIRVCAPNTEHEDGAQVCPPVV